MQSSLEHVACEQLKVRTKSVKAWTTSHKWFAGATNGPWSRGCQTSGHQGGSDSIAWTDKQEMERSSNCAWPAHDDAEYKRCVDGAWLQETHPGCLGNSFFKTSRLGWLFCTSLSYPVSAHFSEHYLTEKSSHLGGKKVVVTRVPETFHLKGWSCLFDPGNPLDSVPIGN